jgi:hypothetical protein
VYIYSILISLNLFLVTIIYWSERRTRKGGIRGRREEENHAHAEYLEGGKKCYEKQRGIIRGK